MNENIITVVDFRNKLFDLFRELNAEDAKLFKYYLADPSKRPKRTNLFLGTVGKQAVWKNGERKFTRWPKWKDDRDKDKCLLMQLHKKLYPELYTSNNDNSALPNDCSYVKDEPWELVWFENMKFDCTYLSNRRILATTEIYPIAWSYDWIIEVENEFEEFAFTLRTLLDVNCNKRMAFFFTDDVKNDDFVDKINEMFDPAWKLYSSSEYTNFIANTDLCLHALIFPDTFEDIKHYLDNTKLVKWDSTKEEFLLEPQYNF